MTILQNSRPMTRAKMAQLSLPDIRAYAKAYKVPANVIEHGTIDELLNLIFELRPRHPEEYPINTPHLFTHKITRTQQDRDEEFRSHKPCSVLTYRKILASFRRAKGWVGRPFQPNEEYVDRAEEAVERQDQPDITEGREPEYPSAHHVHEDPLVMAQPVASSSMTPIYEQPNPPVEYPRERLSPLPGSSHPTLPINQGLIPVIMAPLPSSNGSVPSQPKKKMTPDIPTFQERGQNDRDSQLKTAGGEWIEFARRESRGNRPPPVPSALGFEVADHLSNLKSTLGEHQEAMEARSKPSRIIVDDELFHLEFTSDMTQAGKEAIIRERYAIAMSNRKMIEQALAEAEAEAKQALWQLTTVQPQLDTARENMQKIIDGFTALTGCSNMIKQAVLRGEKMAEDAWKIVWNEDWVFTEDDEKEEKTMREIAQARAAGVQLLPSPSASISRSRKRTRDEDEDGLEYADEEGPQAGAPEPDPKRPRIESRETSTAPPSPSPKGKDKGKGRMLMAEDSYTLPSPSSSFCMPPAPMPRFGPKDRCNVYPVYKPAVPGYEPPQPTGAGDRNQPEQHDGGHLPPTDGDDDSNYGPGPDNENGGEEQIAEDDGEYDEAEERSRKTTQMHRGAPPPATTRPAGPQSGNPWKVLCYDRPIWQGHVFTDHTRMASNLKQPVSWSIMGSRHPKGTSFREWDDELEEQNPWHQGGRPILKQQ